MKLMKVANKYPTFRDSGGYMCFDKWFAGKRLDDNAEGLWRIHDKLYDLSDFVAVHPGGRYWLEMTKGTDITEAFETHHIRDVAEKLLPEFYVRNAALPRNYNMTFHPDGFYRTLKRRVANKLPLENTKAIEARSRLYCDFLLSATILSFILASRQFNIFTALLPAAGIVYLCYIAHNFLHKRDNWRMYVMNLGPQSYRDWRILHVLSHHLYPNSFHDLDISVYQPFFSFLPIKKNFIQRYVSWIYLPIVYVILFTINLVKLSRKMYWDDLIPFSVPILMYVFGNVGILETLGRWLLITVLSSVIHTIVLITGGVGDHHSDMAFHEGDAIKSLDFGVYQLATTFDRAELRTNHFVDITSLSPHGTHHLFPTLDHGLLPQLDEIVFDTCKEFGVKYNICPRYRLMIGEYRQLARTEVYKN